MSAMGFLSKRDYYYFFYESDKMKHYGEFAVHTLQSKT